MKLKKGEYKIVTTEGEIPIKGLMSKHFGITDKVVTHLASGRAVYGFFSQKQARACVERLEAMEINWEIEEIPPGKRGEIMDVIYAVEREVW